MADKNWTYVIDDRSLPNGDVMAVYPLGINILMARVNGQVHAVSGKCAHMGCPLSGGRLEGNLLTCPCHDWRFNVETGEFVDAPQLRLEVFPVRTEDDKIFIDMSNRRAQ